MDDNHDQAAQKAAMLEALTKSLGVVKPALDNSGTTRHQHQRWLSEDKGYREAVDEIDQTVSDMARNMLMTQARSGNIAAMKAIMGLRPRTSDPVEVENEHVWRDGSPPVTPNDDPIPRTVANEPDEAKTCMLTALASNACMGIVHAAIEQLNEDGWHDMTRATHERWLKDDPQYAAQVSEFQAIGRLTQQDAILMNLLATMGDDPGTAKYLGAAVAGIGARDPAPTPKAKPVQSKGTPLDHLSTEELLKLLKQKN